MLTLRRVLYTHRQEHGLSNSVTATSAAVLPCLPIAASRQGLIGTSNFIPNQAVLERVKQRPVRTPG